MSVYWVFGNQMNPNFFLLKSFCLRSNIKHSTQCFISIWNTWKFVKNTPLRVVNFNSRPGASSGDETLASNACTTYLVPLPIHQMLLQSYEEDIKQVSLGSSNHIFFFSVIFGGMALKLEKVCLTLSSFNPCPVIFAIRNNRLPYGKPVSMPSQYKPWKAWLDHYFWIQLMWKL